MARHCEPGSDSLYQVDRACYGTKVHPLRRDALLNVGDIAFQRLRKELHRARAV